MMARARKHPAQAEEHERMSSLKRFAATLVAAAVLVPAAVAEASEPWPLIRKDVFGDRAIKENATSFALYAPAQAADASVVPIDIRFPAAIVGKVKALTLVIDRNPMPLAATFAFEDAYRQLDIGERTLSTRVRIDNFSKVRAILETSDGELHMISKFVAGAGGCSAPASKDPDEALASMGKVQVKTLTSGLHGESWRDGTVMIRHPNFTGMQMDAKTRNYTPARYVDKLEVRLGDKLLFSMLGGISISENPNLRFTYGSAAVADRLSVQAKDTENAKFAGGEDDSGS
jgi:sulfur-oxidizing protein SoxY